MQIENLYTPDCIRTFTGLYVNVFNPDPVTFDIQDVAHALSMQCRFGGHLPYHFSVAQHSVAVSYTVPEEHAFEALMHDASEAYLMDFPRPIKNRIPQYKEIEDGLMKTLSLVFGFTYPLPDEVKIADDECLEDEWESVFLSANKWLCWPQERAKLLFLERFNQLKR